MEDIKNGLPERSEIIAAYDRLIDQSLNEEKLASERTSMYILASTFLTSGFVFALSYNLMWIVSQILGAIGITMSVLHIVTYYYTSMMRWRFEKQIITIENMLKIDDRLCVYKFKHSLEKSGIHRIIARTLGLGPGINLGLLLPLLIIIMWSLLLAYGR